MLLRHSFQRARYSIIINIERLNDLINLRPLTYVMAPRLPTAQNKQSHLMSTFGLFFWSIAQCWKTFFFILLETYLLITWCDKLKKTILKKYFAFVFNFHLSWKSKRNLKLSNIMLETVVLEDDVRVKDLKETMHTFKIKASWPILERLCCFHFSLSKI